jgi:protein-L-isoaspartate(D-aspartate) O-methyltransferase
VLVSVVAAAADYSALRREMVERQIRQRGVKDACVLSALGRVPRERFVPESIRSRAYEDRPLPIGDGQTISQPYIVAVMAEAARLSSEDRVLEIGTGSGYHAAILAECADRVFSVEILPELAKRAQRRLQELGYSRVSVLPGNGRQGWPAHAPYDAIVVTAAGPEIPPALVEQLKEGGVLVMPRGDPDGAQILIVGTKRSGLLEVENLMPVAFVPLTGP